MRAPVISSGRLLVAAVTAFAVTFGASGCTLIQRGWIVLNGKSDPAAEAIAANNAVNAGLSSRENMVLKPIAPSRSTIQVEVVFVERTADDPLFGDLLWRDLDQVGALDPAIREGLKRNGFRIGISSSNPPMALQKLLGLTSEIPDAGNPDETKKFVGRRIALTSGSETELQTSPPSAECSVRAWNGESYEKGEFQNARCLFRMKAQRVQDGWAKLEFTPEIHSGDMRMRQTATEDGWKLKSQQQVKAFSSQRFELTLNQGEMAVIAANVESKGESEEARCLGRHFFVGNEQGDSVKRVLVVRLADLGRSEGVLQK